MPGFFIPKSLKLKDFQVIIVGGGLAGLTAGIHLAQKGVKIALFEKESFPHHKVCGEYLSQEIIPYFEQLEIPLDDLNPKRINRLQYSTARGKHLEVTLPLGGIGVSRFTLDNLLFQCAKEAGVEIFQEKVTDIGFSNKRFSVQSSNNNYSAAQVLGAYGKRSVLDKNLERDFFKKPAPWMAVKSHYKAESFPDDLVALHNFKGGYCGLSKTENEEINLCFLATYKSFKQYKDPEKFIINVLRKNPFLDEFLSNAQPVFEHPLTIAQVSFSRKKAVDNHILMLGDAAGLIHPLCGNGMAMAIHSAKIASEVLLKHLKSKTGRTEMEKEYTNLWEREFSGRLRTGKWLQKLLLKNSLSEFSQTIVSKIPFLLPQIIKQTHGRPIQ